MLALESSSDFRKRRLSYSVHLRQRPSLEAPTKESRRPSLEFRSPPLVANGSASARFNRRLKVKPADNAAARVSPSEADKPLATPPFPDDVLGTYSHHGIEPKYYGEGHTSKINQDRGCVVYPYVDSDRRSLFCVFDGHGERGEDVSEFVLEQIVQKLEADPELVTAPEKALIATFLHTDEALAKSGIDSFFSGTTAVVVFRDGNDLYTANVGDSRAIVARRDPTSHELCAQALSIDQVGRCQPRAPPHTRVHSAAEPRHARREAADRGVRRFRQRSAGRWTLCTRLARQEHDARRARDGAINRRQRGQEGWRHRRA